MPRLRYVLSPLAERDLMAIARYTLETWGASQLRRYRTLLKRAVTNLTENPLRQPTKPRPELAPGCRSYHVGRHIILYRMSGDMLEIARFLHDSMELERHIIQFPSA